MAERKKMICRYCGNEHFPGPTCQYGPDKKHVGVCNGENCIYFGTKFVTPQTCQYSPDRRHKLDN
jgi:hypothetical protein